jgi:hypothetical protein
MTGIRGGGKVAEQCERTATSASTRAAQPSSVGGGMKCRMRPANITAIANIVSAKYRTRTVGAGHPRKRMPPSGTRLRAVVLAMSSGVGGAGIARQNATAARRRQGPRSRLIELATRNRMGRGRGLRRSRWFLLPFNAARHRDAQVGAVAVAGAIRA